MVILLQLSIDTNSSEGKCRLVEHEDHEKLYLTSKFVTNTKKVLAKRGERLDGFTPVLENYGNSAEIQGFLAICQLAMNTKKLSEAEETPLEELLSDLFGRGIMEGIRIAKSQMLQKIQELI